MIPIGDENPSRTKPYVVYGLIVLNILVYIVDRAGAAGPFGNLWNLSMVPASVVHNAPVMVPVPEQFGPFVRLGHMLHTGLDPQWLTIFTSMFMHGSLVHIGGNMLYLWVFGNNIEDVLGHVKFLIFYLVCGVLAALAHIASGPNSPIPTVGASGAIAGVLGAYIVLYPGASIRTLIFFFIFVDYVEIPALIVLGMWFLLQLTGVLGTGGLQGGGVAYWAHVGGFIAGAIIILLMGGRALTRRARRYRLYPPDDNRPYPFRPWK